ncbi:DoxX family protein [Lacibacter sp. H375]|uniref:DoxX family protein n=1 Tax=Lacibacter sp. H375 TaxID=3133424 RepID=UPI0030C0C835
MKQQFFYTGNHWTGFITRVALGLLILPHGLQKAFGLLGGYGFKGTMGWFTETMHIPWLLGAFIIITEFIGAISLIAGFATRFWSIMMIPLMIGAILKVHLPHGWFMNWDGILKGEGFEFHIAIITLSVITLLNGAGRFSFDRKIAAA